MIQNTFFGAESEVTTANLDEAIQQAIEIAIAYCPDLNIMAIWK